MLLAGELRTLSSFAARTLANDRLAPSCVGQRDNFCALIDFIGRTHARTFAHLANGKKEEEEEEEEEEFCAGGELSLLARSG